MKKSKEKLKKVGQWLGKSWWILLICILTVAFVYAYMITHYQLCAPDKYTIIVDLILIILAFVTLAGGAAFLVIRAGVQRRAEEIADETLNLVRGETLGNLGFVCWNQYKQSREMEEKMNGIRAKLREVQSKLDVEESDTAGRGEIEPSEPTSDDSKDYLELAINYSRRAAEYLDRLPEEKYEESKCALRNNVAFYLAKKEELGRRVGMGDRELARAYAEYIYKRVLKYPQHREAWIDTWTEVKSQFPDNHLA